MLAAQRRAFLAYDQSIDHRGSQALVAGRALLRLCSTGDDRMLQEHIAAYSDRPDLLEALLLALAAAAEETSDFAETARRVWPSVIRQLVELETEGHKPFDDDRHAMRTLAALLPVPTYQSAYLYREIADKPIVWSDIEAWGDEVKAWTDRARGSGDCVDTAVAVVRTLPIAAQSRVGLPWVSDLALAEVDEVHKYGPLSAWLRELRTHMTSQSDIDAWQKLVDALVIAGDTSLAPYSP